jgi:hypothetical protein
LNDDTQSNSNAVKSRMSGYSSAIIRVQDDKIPLRNEREGVNNGDVT